jgi:hypothetical protein
MAKKMPQQQQQQQQPPKKLQGQLQAARVQRRATGGQAGAIAAKTKQLVASAKAATAATPMVGVVAR